MISVDDMQEGDQFYEHIFPDGKQLLIATSTLLRSPVLQMLPIVQMPVDAYDVAMQFYNRAIDRRRLRSLLAVAEPDPIVVIEMGMRGNDYEVYTLDGRHRTVTAFRRGWKFISARFVPREIWEEFVIDLGVKIKPYTDVKEALRRPLYARMEYEIDRS